MNCLEKSFLGEDYPKPAYLREYIHKTHRTDFGKLMTRSPYDWATRRCGAHGEILIQTPTLQTDSLV